MSQIIDAIGRLGMIAQKENSRMGWCLTVSYVYSPYNEGYLKLKKDSFRGHLTEKEIDEIMKPFPFKLSQEMYDLYQTGNGHFPFDISKIQEYDYCKDIANYYYCSLMRDEYLMSLQESIDITKSILSDLSFHNSYFLFPLCTFEDFVLLTILDTKKKETSPIYFMDDTLVYKFYQNNLSRNDLEQYEIWSSLTNMMLAYAKLYEKKDSRENIYKKYGNNTDRGLDLFH